MAAPTFVSKALSSFATQATATTSTFNANAGDVLGVQGGTEDGAYTLGTPTGGGLTYSLAQSVVTGSYCGNYAWTASVGSAQTGMAVASSISGTHFGGIGAALFRNSGGVGASAKANASGSPSVSITTTQANSAVLVFVGDWNAVDGTSRTWLTVNGYTPTAANGQELTYQRNAQFATMYWAYYPDVGAAGAKTVGLSAPTGQKYTITAVEIKGSATSTPSQGTASGSIAFAGSAAGKATMRGTASGSVTYAGSAAGKTTMRGTGSGSVAFSGTASGTRTPKGSGTGNVAYTGSATGSAPAVGSRNGTASGTYAYSGTASGTRTPKGGGSGSYAYAGSATGTAPVVGQKTGTAAGTVAYVGTAAGKRQPKGTATGAYALVGAATGVTTRAGTAVGSYAYLGTAVGHSASVIPPADRTTLVRAESRLTRIAAESRVTTVPAERRVTEIR